MNWRPRLIDVHEWAAGSVWRILRSRKGVSVYDIEQELIPPSNSIADLQMRDSDDAAIRVWWAMTARERQAVISGIIDELRELHRLTTKGTEKFSRYRPLLEVEALDSLSRII